MPGRIKALSPGRNRVVEDYIDLIPILENLLIDPKTFLAPIREVTIRYDAP